MAVAHLLRVALLALVLARAIPAAASVPLPDFHAVEEAARDAVDSGDIPGVVILIGRRHEVLLEGAWGARRLVPDRAPMTVDTIFDIASLTKPLGTTLAVMRLVEEGAVELDAPVGRYLREFAGGRFRGVTVRRLLTHSAGLPALAPTSSVQAGFPGAARSLADLPFAYTPGAGFQYSDTGFIVLGELVRRAGGEALDQYLDRILFRPLGLADTGFRPPAAKRARIAPTERHRGRVLQGEVHDPRARALGGVAGHAGMFSTAPDLARIVRMLLSGGALAGRRVLRPETVELMWARTEDGERGRTLGWDATSLYARGMAPFFPPGSVGHTGFTGTAVWLDPASGVYMIVLTSRLHPAGGGAARIRELRLRVAAATGAALFTAPPPDGAAIAPAEATAVDPPASTPRALIAAPAVTPPARPPAPRVRTGLDVLVAEGFKRLAGRTVGLVTNHTGVDRRGRRAIDLLAAAPGVRLAAIFSPEHGLSGQATADVPHGRDAVTGRPIWSLYGPARRPTPAMLRDVTTLVFDIQDVGARYYTYLTTLLYVMEEAAQQRIPVVVLDRPNPITGRVVDGPLLDADLESFTGPHPVPVRTGLTIGEFARLAAAERRIPVTLTVVPLEGWDRARWHDETGLPWVNPSPNIRSVAQALLYSGVGLLEATNVSVGRGTDAPFELVGAPWIEPDGLAEALNRRGLRGVRFEPVHFTPAADIHARQRCGGVRLVVTDRDAMRPYAVALALALELRARHRDQFRPESIQNLLVNRSTMWALLRGEPLERLLARADAARSRFLNRRAPYLMY